jgi:fumarate hydratase class II
MSDGYRIEKDSLGEMKVPEDALYGPQTRRAVENFPISGLRFGRGFIEALALIKKAAAETNAELGHLDARVAESIVAAAAEVAEGRWDDQFVLDIYQTGSGTSTNMNANEVIARRATQVRKDGGSVHPNDHVNFGQSSNDVIPTAIHIAARVAIEKQLVPALTHLRDALAKKAEQFDGVMKSGRTHLMDATPVRLGQEFAGYAAQVSKGIDRVQRAAAELEELALGGTATGTGINTDPEFAAKAIGRIAKATGVAFREADDHFEAQGAKDAAVSAAGALNTVATSLMKIADDLRWLGSGPTSGIFEIRLPAIQPGSSIMPGKVNPSIPEMVNQVCFQVMGCDLTVAVAAEAGQLELNVMMPVIAWNTLHATRIMREAMRTLQEKCVDGIRADRDRCRELLDMSTAVATALSPYIGYEATADIAKTSVRTGRSIQELVRERRLLPEQELNAVLSVEAMTSPGVAGAGKERGHDTADRGDSAAGAGGKRRAGRRTAAAREAVSAGEPGPARRTGSRGVAAARSGHGRPGDRGKHRRR